MTNIDVRNLSFDIRALGKEMILTAINPVYEYVNGAKTNKVIGYRYTVVLPQCGYQMLDIKVPGDKQVDLAAGATMPVQFSGLVLKPYVNYREHNALAVTATATEIRKA